LFLPLFCDEQAPGVKITQLGLDKLFDDSYDNDTAESFSCSYFSREDRTLLAQNDRFHSAGSDE
jgi:hypothetical protein